MRGLRQRVHTGTDARLQEAAREHNEVVLLLSLSHCVG